MSSPYPNSPLEPPALPLHQKDRSVGLTVFGIFTILLGCIAALFVPLMVFGQMTASKATGTPPSMAMVVPAILLYSFLAVALIWAGIGSIMARRWARALLLIFSWSWLIMGLLGFVVLVLVLPKTLANLAINPAPHSLAMPPAVMTGVVVGMFVVTSVIYVILPAIWTFFYSSRHVRATCEKRDPVSRWTDACPLPVLAVCLWLAISVPMMLVTPLAANGVTPFFGTFLTGAPGTVFCLTMAVIWGYSAWSLYKRERRGWWVILITLCLFMVSGLLTFAHHDVLEMYRLMGYPEAQIQQIQKSGLLIGSRMGWIVAAFSLPFFGYLFFIRKYLK